MKCSSSFDALEEYLRIQAAIPSRSRMAGLPDEGALDPFGGSASAVAGGTGSLTGRHRQGSARAGGVCGLPSAKRRPERGPRGAALGSVLKRRLSTSPARERADVRTHRRCVEQGCNLVRVRTIDGRTSRRVLHGRGTLHAALPGDGASSDL